MKLTTCLILFAIFSSLSIARADQGRAPHGLVYESPIAFSPQAYDFFHPNAKSPSAKTQFDAESLSPLPLAATVQSDVAHASRSTPDEARNSGAAAGGIAAIVFGIIFAAILAMGVYIAVIRRRAKLNRSKFAQPVA